MAKKATEKVDETEREAEAAEEQPQKRCLMITPIGPEESDIRRATNGLFWEVIVPVCEQHGYKADVSHEMSEPGSIMDQVVGRLIDDELVIADLTNNNPNVAYELAIRHAARKPVICLIHAASKLPFDLQGERVIVYRSDMMGVRELKAALATMILAVEKAKGVVDNPVVRGAKTFRLTTQEVPQSESQAIMRRLDSIERRLSATALAAASGSSSAPVTVLVRGTEKRLDNYYRFLEKYPAFFDVKWSEPEVAGSTTGPDGMTHELLTVRIHLLTALPLSQLVSTLDMTSKRHGVQVLDV